LNFLDNIPNQEGVFILGETHQSEFEKLYVALREKEGRILSDEQVKSLPYLKDSPLTNEWKLRQESTKKFLTGIAKKGKLSVLEIGCGNGWFSNQMALTNQNEVVGQDINLEELKQARRCFELENLNFICCYDLEQLPDGRFDLIVFNASVQYFEFPNKTFELLKTKLKQNGEIHIIDSPFYMNQEEASAAKNRSIQYYNDKGFAPLSSFYYHHLIGELSIEKVHYKPSKIGKAFGKRNPFYWIQVKTS